MRRNSPGGNSPGGSSPYTVSYNKKKWILKNYWSTYLLETEALEKLIYTNLIKQLLGAIKEASVLMGKNVIKQGKTKPIPNFAFGSEDSRIILPQIKKTNHTIKLN